MADKELNFDSVMAEIRLLRTELSSLRAAYDTITEELERRIDALEKSNVVIAESDLVKRLKKLEDTELKRQGLAAGLGLASGGTITALIEWLRGM